MKNKIIFVALIIVLAILAISYALNANNSALSPGEFNKQINQGYVQLVDIRSADEFAAEHIEKAVNINYRHKFFVENFSNFDREIPLYIYCKTGMRTIEAVPVLHGMGFKKIYSLKGGIKAWKEAGFKVVEGKVIATGL